MIMEFNNTILLKNKKLAVERFGSDFHIGSEDNIAYKCPFCNKRRGKPDNDYKMYVSLRTSAFWCFKCHAKGYLNKRKNVTEASYSVYKDLLNLVSTNDTEDDDSDDNVFYIPNVKIGENSVAYEYCVDRGITKDIIDYYDIRLGTEDLFGRIVVPNVVYGSKGLWTDIYSARSYLNQEPKYWMPSDCEKSDIVFNIHRIDNGCDNLFINEGVITSIMAGKSSVAVFGCHPSNSQIKQIVSKRAKNYYCTLDNDSAGRIPNEKLAEAISKLIGNDSNVYLAYLPEGLDAADLGESKYIEYVMDNRILFNNPIYGKICSYFVK